MSIEELPFPCKVFHVTFQGKGFPAYVVESSPNHWTTTLQTYSGASLGRGETPIAAVQAALNAQLAFGKPQKPEKLSLDDLEIEI